MSEPYTPHEYQREVIKFIISRACAGILLKPGLGKTSAMLAAFEILRKKGMVRSMLVICPLRPMYSVWPAEVEKWAEFKHLRVSVLHGPGKDAALRRKADIYVVNPEGLDWLFHAVARPKPTDPFPWDVLVVDESTRFKHTQTQRFKTLKPWLKMFARRYILTGSPAPNGLLDLFGQIYILDFGTSLGPTMGFYKTQWFFSTGFGGYTFIPREGAEEEIYEKLKPLVVQMDDEDWLEMPPLIFNTVKIDLPKKARAIYDQMEQILIASLEDETVTAANAAVATGKCRQIANGGLYHEDGKWTHIHEEKVDAVEEIIEELSGKPALVAYEYQHDLDRLRKRLGEVPHIGGGVSPGRFREIEAAWNRGEIPVLLAQPQSVAHGLNLQGTSADVIFMGQTWNLEDREQFIRRVWRQGQKERVVVHDIVARKTVDEVIVAAIKRKDKTQSALLAALKTHLRRKP